MTSAWSTRACVVVAVVGALMIAVKSSAVVDARRMSAQSRLVAPLCNALLMDDDDVIDARKRKWGENTMMTWGKRSVLDTIYALSLCESLRRNLHPGSENSVSTWKRSSEIVDAKDPGWDGFDLEFVDKPSSNLAVDAGDRDRENKRNWSENTMATWGRRK